jgi:hypothetical protein
MHSYGAYGLHIRSELALPELTEWPSAPDDTSVDVTVRRGAVQRPVSRLTASGLSSWVSADEACHIVEDVGAFLARRGREIIVDPAPAAEDRVLRLSILGPALGLVLYQRGVLVLHASVIARDGEAFAFLGNNGWGKSTIAAALHAKGYDLVADDVAAITTDRAEPCVLPGFPQVKLWPEAATLLGETPECLPQLHPSFDKRAWRAERGFSLEPRRLARIYVLAAGPGPSIERLQPRESCLELMAHWYGHRFGSGLLQGDSAALHLAQCAALAGRVSGHRLFRSGGSKALLELADVVDEHLRRDLGTPVRA